MDFIDFINFCELQENDDTMCFYLRFLLHNKQNTFFNSLYERYCNKNNIIVDTNSEHYELCKFYALEHFYDESLYHQDDRKNVHIHYNDYVF